MYNNKDIKSAFSLIEMAMVLVIMSLLVTGVLSVGSVQLDVQNRKLTNERMVIIEDAMLSYFIKNKRLPCPANPNLDTSSASFGVESRVISDPDSCNNSTLYATGEDSYIGIVPIRTLGLSDEIVFDAWGNRIDYATTKSFINNVAELATCIVASQEPSDNTNMCFAMHTEGGANNLNVRVSSSGANITTNGAYVLISHGKNGFGAYPRFMGVSGVAKNTNPTDADELKNIDTNFNRIFVQKNQTSTFDDIVRFKTRNNLVMECNKLVPNSTYNCSGFAW